MEGFFIEKFYNLAFPNTPCIKYIAFLYVVRL